MWRWHGSVRRRVRLVYHVADLQEINAHRPYYIRVLRTCFDNDFYLILYYIHMDATRVHQIL